MFREDYIIYNRSLENFFIDLSSFLIILIILFIIFLTGKINKKMLIFFGLYSLTPFIFNDILIDSSNLWDQYTNTFFTLEARNIFLDVNQYISYADFGYYNEKQRKILLLSNYYAILPFISFSSINTIAFANKLILILTSIYLLNKNYIKKSDLFFILLFPATIVYSSLSLKAILICVLLIWSLILFFEKKYFLFLVVFFLSFYLRVPFFGFVAIFILYFIVLSGVKKIKYSFLLLNFLIILIIYKLSGQITSFANHYIYIYTSEDSGWGAFSYKQNLNYFSFSLSDIFTNLSIIFNKLIVNWPARIEFKFLMMIDNILFFSFLVKNFKKNFSLYPTRYFVALVSLVLSIFVLYTIIPNLLVLHRYFYPYIIFYLIFTCLRGFENHKKLKKI